MEAVGEFVPDQADRPGSAMPARLRPLAAVPCAAGDPVDCSVAAALALLRACSESAAGNVARLNFVEASDFADDVEDLSRTVEYLQIIAAAGVDRTRREAAAVQKASAGWGSDTAAGTAGDWLTGWNQEPGESTSAAASTAVAASAVADDGYRNSAEFLQARLRIGASEAKRRLVLAAELLPRTGIAGRALPPARQELAAAVA
ncbi:hypothetical protein [Arthrobacter sp. ok362]|uniref:hypothetical protein n=1 Tax=Arthrobacter sp. ok362 TaxID=1761745 RepID=UPI0008816D32|nr:hypothetical protein [Arthrobacter sp. ok362]SDK48786.1 hypothetical protein SAMN04487913_101391 [Arthrobacter sp. ok362]